VNTIGPDQWLYFSALLREFERKNKLSDGFLSAGEARFREALEKYLFLLIEKNHAINLTAIDSFESAVWKHLYDSLLLLNFEPLGLLLDWGTGGGTPGIPLALFRKHILNKSSDLVFLDSVGKKVACVKEFCSTLDILDANFFIGRGEEYIRMNKVNTVVMRAVAPPRRAITWVSDSVDRWVFMTGPRGAEEWRGFSNKMQSRGFSERPKFQAELPLDWGTRHIISFSKQ